MVKTISQALEDLADAMRGGSSEGGGSDSDYSTAEVTIVDDTDSSVPVLYAPILTPDGSSAINIADAEQTYGVILQNGLCALEVNQDNVIVASGDAEVVTIPPFGIKMVHITGNCTLTISDAQ